MRYMYKLANLSNVIIFVATILWSKFNQTNYYGAFQWQMKAVDETWRRLVTMICSHDRAPKEHYANVIGSAAWWQNIYSFHPLLSSAMRRHH